jgi:hypothetical protein
MPGKIYGPIPDINSTKLYEIQVGAYKITENAEDTFLILKRGGLDPVYEKYLDYTRVKIIRIPAREIRSYLIKIKQLGFNEVIIREDNTPCTVIEEPEPEPEPEPEIEPEEEIIYEAEEPEITPELPDRDIFCRTWSIVNSDKDEHIGYIMIFSNDGTYLITNTTGETVVAKWRWHDNEHTEFEYTHDNWRSYGRVEINQLDENSLIFKDPGFNILGRGHSTIRKDTIYELVPIENFQQDMSEE